MKLVIIGKHLNAMAMSILYYVKSKRIVPVRYIANIDKYSIHIDNVYMLTDKKTWTMDYSFWLNEAKKYSLWNYLPIEGDVVIDLGAGLGEEMIVYSTLVGKTGLVFAIESDPITYQSLEYVKSKNSFTNVKVFNLAINDLNENVSFSHDVNYLKSFITESVGLDSLEVRGITLDSFIEMNEIETVNLLKSNIEGAEQLLIKGMGQSLSKIKHVAISCHDFRYNNENVLFFKTKKNVVDFLLENNFDVFCQNTGHVVMDDYVYASNKNMQ